MISCLIILKQDITLEFLKKKEDILLDKHYSEEYNRSSNHELHQAEVAELADAADSKSAAVKSVWVRVPPSAEHEKSLIS